MGKNKNTATDDVMWTIHDAPTVPGTPPVPLTARTIDLGLIARARALIVRCLQAQSGQILATAPEAARRQIVLAWQREAVELLALVCDD